MREDIKKRMRIRFNCSTISIAHIGKVQVWDRDENGTLLHGDHSFWYDYTPWHETGVNSWLSSPANPTDAFLYGSPYCSYHWWNAHRDGIVFNLASSRQRLAL